MGAPRFTGTPPGPGLRGRWNWRLGAVVVVAMVCAALGAYAATWNTAPPSARDGEPADGPREVDPGTSAAVPARDGDAATRVELEAAVHRAEDAAANARAMIVRARGQGLDADYLDQLEVRLGERQAALPEATPLGPPPTQRERSL